MTNINPRDIEHIFERLRSGVVSERGLEAFAVGIDRWIARIEDATIDGGANPEAPDFDTQVQQRLEADLASLTGGKAPEDMARVLRAIFALKLRELYLTKQRKQLNKKVTLEFIDLLVAKVSEGFGGDVGIVPRQFLRQLVNILDLAATEPEFDPMTDGGYEFTELNSEEARIRDGLPYFEPEPTDAEQYAVTFWMT